MTAPPAPEFVAARWHGGAQTPRAVVMHGTVSPDDAGTAQAIARFFARENNKTSAHYIVDPSTVIQTVGDHTVAYHCGYNQDSIGVELCDEETGPASRWNDANSNAILERAAALVAQLCLAYGIDITHPTVAELKRRGPHGIYSHNDSRLAFGHTTHSDPIDFPWPRFMRLVRAHANTLTHGSTAAPTQEEDMPYSDWPKADRDALAKDVADAVIRTRLPHQTDAPKGRYVGATLTGIYNMVREIRDGLRQAPGK